MGICPPFDTHRDAHHAAVTTAAARAVMDGGNGNGNGGGGDGVCVCVCVGGWVAGFGVL